MNAPAPDQPVVRGVLIGSVISVLMFALIIIGSALALRFGLHPQMWAALAGMGLIDALWIANGLAWAAVFLMLLGSVWRVLAGRSRHFDVLWALIAGFALMVLGFNLRWYIAAESLTAYAGLYVYSILLAFLTVRAVRSYGAAHHG